MDTFGLLTTHRTLRRIVVLLLSGLLAACGGGETQGTAVSEGQRIYNARCASCHQPDGQGISGMYPPLAETRWTAGDRGRLIRLVLHGMKGPVEVRGETYDQVMLAHSFLSDEEIAEVLTFVRNEFGGTADSVTGAMVERVRAASTQEGPWTPDVLWKQTGVPELADSSGGADAAR